MEPGGRRHLGCDGNLDSGLSLRTRISRVLANRGLWPVNAPVVIRIDYSSPNTVNSAHLIGIVCDPRLIADSIQALY